MKNVFISSVMKGFDSERTAARTAVESLRLSPVMAESFGARPHSSQIACLEGVRSSQVFVLVLAHRYGFVAQSGKSVTEEEFLEARNRGLDVLVFVQKGELEEAQQAFLDRIGNYEEGYFVKFFSDPTELQTQVTTALHDLVSQPGVSVLTPERARSHAERFLATRSDGSIPLLNAIVFPARSGEEYISPLDMGEESFKNAIAQAAMFGSAAIFQAQHGYQTEEGREHVRFQQGDRHERTLNAVEIHADGTLFWQASISGDDGGSPYSMLRQYVIDQRIVL